jgi:tight adherence protein C
VPVFLGSRIALPIAAGFSAVTILGFLGMTSFAGLIATVWFAALGYIAPSVYVNGRIRTRQKEMQRALPDALDLLVVCVEAGLGLNQALVRVADEIHRLSPVLSEQMSLVNYEIRAGTAREEALRNWGERTGLGDIASLAGMLIQTDRFGTSVAQALRIHADTMRTKRRQRAEEAAAKTTIKLIFPLVFCIFPSMFVVILGPAMIQIMAALKGFG